MQFNRRQNRIAGPGFHCNVRFDDQTMARAHSQVNECHTLLKQGTTLKENFDVKEQELLVTMAKNGMYHDGYTHCFSFVNGLPGTKTTADDKLEEAILQSVRYVGVATTEYKPSRSYSEQGFVAQVGGVSTLINESDETIKPGDTLVLGVNLKHSRRTARDKGISPSKLRFCIRKAKVGDALIQQALEASGATAQPSAASLKTAKTEVENAKKAVKKAELDLKKAKAAKPLDATAVQGAEGTLQTAEGTLQGKESALAAVSICSNGPAGLKKFLSKLQELNSRVIGRSCSYARPGDRLEVVLQPRNPY